MFFYSLTLLLAFACVACEFKLKPNEENDPSLQMKVQRYDRLESRYLTTGDFAALQEMNTEYPMETRTLIEDMLQLGEVNDPGINNKFLNFFQDSLLQILISEAEYQYADMSDVDKQLKKSFDRLQELLPSLPMPIVYSQIGALGQSIVIGENMIGVSLDKYLGADFPIYASFFEEVQRKTMNRKNIVPDCLVFYLLSHYQMTNLENSSQEERDIHMGRVMWVANKALGQQFFRTRLVEKADEYMKKHPRTKIEEFLSPESVHVDNAETTVGKDSVMNAPKQAK
ncbi:MAG: gliding motility protein GldB [Prevotella sp.]|nr:gliding motility protein GldB [Prevotella sp.]